MAGQAPPQENLEKQNTFDFKSHPKHSTLSLGESRRLSGGEGSRILPQVVLQNLKSTCGISI